MEREKKTRKHSGSFHSGGPARKKKTETNVKLDSSVRTVTDGWPMKHTQGVCCHGQKRRGRKARSTAVCLIFVFFQDFENVGRTFGCCLRAEKQQLLYSYRMEPAELDGSIRNVKPQLGRKTARNGMHVARVGSSARAKDFL